MFRRRISVSVPQPCQEKWHHMTAQGQGRFCGSCQKVVVDFTQMNDAEVAQWLSRPQAQICGRFKPDQLHKNLFTSVSSSIQWPWKAALLALATWTSLQSGEAKGKTAPITELREQPFTNTLAANKIKPEQTNDSVVIITGKVLDAASGEPVSGAAVVVKGKTIGAPTELTGNFTLHIPASVPPESTTITFSYIGFVTQEVKLDYLLQNPALVIRLALDNTALMGETFIIHSKWYSPRGLYYSIRNLFR